MKTFIKKITLLGIAMLVFGCSKDDNPAASVDVKTKVKITGYKIDNFPFVTTGGLGWDGVNGLPDVYVGLFDGTTLIYRSNTVNNVTQSGLPLNVSLVSPYYLVPSFSNTINIVVMDDDLNDSPSNTDDEIGYVPFIMNDYTTGANKYPSTVTKTANGVTVTLSLTWE